MMFIDLEELSPQVQNLLPAFEEAGRAVAAESNLAKRKALIDLYRQRCSTQWSELRTIFAEYSYGKCWYVECKTSGADNDLDHYRPKSKVLEEAEHPGYYWLAFDWTNLRLSCQRANRPRRNPDTGETGGKAAYFPLFDPLMRAWSPTDDLAREAPQLLDPTVATDVAMVTFTADGRAALGSQFRSDDFAQARFTASERYLNINFPEFIEDRIRLYNKISNLIARGSREWERYGSTCRTERFLDTVRDLIRMMKPTEEYSRAARAFIELWGAESWVQNIVLRV